MEEWQRTALCLCIFGLTRGLRPSESYKVPFLLGPWRNITKLELNSVVYPIALYSYAIILVAIFLLTDLLRFKPIIVLSGLSGVFVYGTLLWTESLLWLQVSQVIFGLYMATEVAYLTYMFAKVDPEHYAKVSSYTRASSLLGRFISGVSAQLLTTLHLMDYRQLNYITFATQSLSIVWALMLPSVGFSVYFHTTKKTPKHCIEAQDDEEYMCSDGLYLVFKHAKMAYRNPGVVAWSLWYAGINCAFSQCQSYIQLLWTYIDPDAQNVYNGAVEAALTLLGACGALAAQSCGSHGLAAVLAGPLAALICIGGIVTALTTNIFIAYSCYISLGVLYYFLITLSSTQIAQRLGDDSCFGLIFGINSLVATVFQSLLTYVAITCLQLTITTQFIVYGSIFGVMSIAWMAGWTSVVCRGYFWKKTKKEEPNNNHG